MSIVLLIVITELTYPCKMSFPPQSLCFPSPPHNCSIFPAEQSFSFRSLTLSRDTRTAREASNNRHRVHGNGSIGRNHVHLFVNKTVPKSGAKSEGQPCAGADPLTASERNRARASERASETRRSTFERFRAQIQQFFQQNRAAHTVQPLHRPGTGVCFTLRSSCGFTLPFHRFFSPQPSLPIKRGNVGSAVYWFQFPSPFHHVTVLLFSHVHTHISVSVSIPFGSE